MERAEGLETLIIESVDSINTMGMAQTHPLYVIQYKKPKTQQPLYF